MKMGSLTPFSQMSREPPGLCAQMVVQKNECFIFTKCSSQKVITLRFIMILSLSGSVNMELRLFNLIIFKDKCPIKEY